MTLVDANILLYAVDASSDRHRVAVAWWDARLSGGDPVCLCWTVIGAFVRISTNKRVFEVPLLLDEACEKVSSWLRQPCVRIVHATDRHWEIFEQMLKAGQASGNLVTDAHLAAIAVENGCTLFSSDADFSRFPGLRWVDPLK